MMVDILKNIMKDPSFVEKFWTEPFLRFMKHFPLEGDDDLAILKGHLLIEELLWEFVADNVSNKEALKKLDDDHNFGFKNLTNLAEALNPREQFNWLWRAIIKLNKIRNSLAHNLEPKGIEDKINDFINFVQDNDKLPWRESHLKEFGKLRLAIWTCHKYLTILIEYESMMEIVKKSMPTLSGKRGQP